MRLQSKEEHHKHNCNPLVILSIHAQPCTCARTPTHVCAYPCPRVRTHEDYGKCVPIIYQKLSQNIFQILANYFPQILPQNPPLQSPQNPCNFDSIRVHESCPKSMPLPCPIHAQMNPRMLASFDSIRVHE